MTEPQGNDRVHAVLDGDLPRSALPEGEAIRLAEIEAAIGKVVDTMGAAESPDLVSSVMRRLPSRDHVAPSLWQRALGWLWAPRAVRITLRPAYAFAAVALLALLIPLGDVPAVLRTGSPDSAGAPGSVPVYVQFRLDAPAASRVVLVGSFTNWQPVYELHETAPGLWSVLVPLSPGVHDYAFVVDGEQWVVDPKAPRVADSFGGVNSRLALPPPRDAA